MNSDGDTAPMEELERRKLLEQGVSQGDIISPQLFILMVEILLIKITKSKNIQGIVHALTEAKAV